MNSIYQEQQANRHRLLLLVGWSLVLVSAVLAYWPGLEGPFLFDDFGSIPPLGDHGGVTNWETFRLFVSGGAAGPTGRPISLLTFLIDGNNWPTEAWPFKRTNLVIHLINGVLLGVAIRMILKFLEFKQSDARWVTLIVAAIWILHPYLVSTTLYAVQRMAQLSALFVFAGIALYLHGRSLLATAPRRAYLIMSTAIAVFTLLAMLSKENGILLPSLIGVIELTVLASQRHRIPALNRYWLSAFIILPTVVIGMYLGTRVLRDDFFEIVIPRDYSVYERLLTQGRVVVEYLQHWFFPKLYTTGVFQDHFIKSTGLFTPVTTLPGLALHLALIVVAFVKRRRWPLFSLAILFFYTGHLLESTVLNLELYFEHRNYIPAALLFLPLVAFVYKKLSLRVFGIAAVSVLLLLGSFTRYSATVWSNLPSIVESSALKAPTSERAQAQYAKLLFTVGKYDEAVATVNRAIENIPGDRPLLITTKLYLLCNRNMLDLNDFESSAERLSRTRFDSRSLKAYNVFAQEVATGRCPNIELSKLESMFVKMLDVPPNGDPTTLQYSHVNFLIGYVRAHSGKPVRALEAFRESLRARPGATHAMAMAALMASNNYSESALQLADIALSQLGDDVKSNLLGDRVNKDDILAFIATVREDIGARQGSGTSDPAQ